MQNLSIAESGYSYIFYCVLNYCGKCLYLILYLLFLLYLLIKGKRDEKRIFLYPAILIIVTVLNPVFPVLINSFFDVNKEYYRFLWIIPVVPALAYFAADKICKVDNTIGKRVTLFLIAAIAFICTGSFVYADGYNPQENIYKIPYDVMDVANIIHDNGTVKYPKAVCDFELHMELRQYDATILLAIDRSEYLDVINNEPIDSQVEEERRFVNGILDVTLRGERPSYKDFQDCLDATNTEFVVIKSDNTHLLSYLEGAGLKRVGATKERIVMHYDLKAPIDYDLADYSEFW